MLSLEKVTYQFFIWCYGIAIRVASLFDKKAKLWVQGRADLFETIALTNPSNKPAIWIHCASLGEFEQGRPLLEKIKKAYPHLFIVLTFFSPSGYEVRKDYKHADLICYMPLDSKRNAKQFIQAIQPSLAIFVKYEFWLNHLTELHQQHIPSYLISSIFRKEQPFFKWYGKWHQLVLKNYNHVFVQTTDSVRLLQDISIPHVSLANDTRFDRVASFQKQAPQLFNPLVFKFKGTTQLLIAGSTWPADEDKLVKWINQSLPYNWKIVIAPHQINEKLLQRLEDRFRKSVVRYSTLSEKNASKAKVLIVDNVGMLNEFYKIGKLAFVGGGFGQGIHNILEPAAHGLPIVFGPNYQRFNEANELIDVGGAFSVQSFSQLKKVLHKLIFTKGAIARKGVKCSNYVSDREGGTAVIFDQMQSKLQEL